MAQSSVAVFKLLAFPVFDKRDSLLYFPHSVSRHLNSGDHDALSKLMHSYLHGKWTYHRMLEMFYFSTEVHPDSLMCVHSTKVVENQIFSTMYFKSTDCKLLNNSLRRTILDPTVLHMITARDDRLKGEIASYGNLSDEEQQRMVSLVDSDEDLVIYGRMDLQMTMDSHTKKVTGLSFNAILTSVAVCTNSSIA